MVLVSGKSQSTCRRTGPIDHTNMLVRLGDAVYVQKTRSDQGACPRAGGGRTLADELHIESALFLRLAQSGSFRIFVELDMSAKRQPLLELPVVHQQDAV